MQVSKSKIDNMIEDIVDDPDIKEIGGWYDDSCTEEEDNENMARYIREELFGESWKKGGLKNIPKSIVLFRIVFLKNENALEEDYNGASLGHHWTYSKDTIDIGILEGINCPEEDKKPFIIEAVFKCEDIDIGGTVYNRMAYENESEITIKYGAKPISFTITKYQDSDMGGH